MPGGGIHNWQQGVGVVALVTGMVLWHAYDIKQSHDAILGTPEAAPAIDTVSWTMPALANPLVAWSPVAWAALAGALVLCVGVVGAVMLARQPDATTG